ncbi:hypothetical protein D9M68_852560 [compost metagenome]
MAGPLLVQLRLQWRDTQLRGRRQLLFKSREKTPVELPLAGHTLAAQAEGTAAPAAGKQHRHAATAGLGDLDRRGPQVLTTGAQQHVDLRHPFSQPQAGARAGIGHGHHQVSLVPGLFEYRQQRLVPLFK